MKQPDVLLLDDGELEDVKERIEEIGAPYGRVRGGAIVPNTPPPRRLLVTTPRRIEAVRLPEPGTPEADALMRIVVVDEDSPSLRSQLREVGFDYLVRRPVHPEALRLLLLHCLYTGEERRSEPRIPVGFEVSFRTGLLPRKATLADLSTRGCRVLSRWGLEPGKRITITIPERAGVAGSVTVKGRVLRMALDERIGPEGPYSAAVAFEPLEAKQRHEIEWILEERARGPATLDAKGQPTGEPAASERRSGRDRRTPIEKPSRERRGGAAKAAPATVELEPPELRSDDVARGIDVEVDVAVEPPAPEPPPAAPLPPSREEPPRAAPPAPPAPEPPEADPESSAAAFPGDRRRSPRGAYARRVPAFGDRAMRVLVARDLSMGGMRVEKDSGVELGDRLHLAIYGAAEEEPFLVWATVNRDDGPRGLVLSFEEVHPLVAQQLEKVVTSLPAVESLHDDEASAMGTVVTEILDR